MATQDDAANALFFAITKVAKKGADLGTPIGGAMVRDAAIAYRAVMGGPQPGSVVVKNG